jgi:hypothetical protein
MPVFIEKNKNLNVPKLVNVQQIFDHQHRDNIEEIVSTEIHNLRMEEKIIGKRIAIAVGSRGILHHDRIVKATIDTLTTLGANPFIVTAMGSHGSGTSAGQLEILESYGITEEKMGVPIFAEQKVIQVGATKSGIPVVVDQKAWEAEMIVVVNRVKSHTDFSGDIESGLCKMLAIGLGKQEGCSRYHNEGFDHFPTLIPEIASIVIENTKVGFGIGIIENAYGETYDIKAVAAKDILRVEPKLLSVAKRLKPSIMIHNIDLLIVDEIGKDISGGGMDSKITGILGYKEKWKVPGFNGPTIKMTFVLSLSKATHGNANGIGLADFTLKSLFHQIDFEATYTNALASKAIDGTKIPMLVDTYEEGIVAGFAMTNYDDISQMKIVRIHNTLSLDTIQVSENLIPEVMRNPKMKILHHKD